MKTDAPLSATSNRDPALPASSADRVERTVAPLPARQFAARLHRRPEDVEAVWRSLERGGGATVYQGYEWARCALMHLAGPVRAAPFIVEVRERDGEAPLMLLPLVVRRRHGCRAIEWVDFGVCDYSAPLVAPGLELSAEEMGRAWTAVREVLPPADVIRISRIPEGLAGGVNPLALLAERQRMDLQAFGLPIDGDPATLLKRVCTPSMAREIAANARRLQRVGAVRFMRADTAEDARQVFAALIDQRLKRFREVGRFDLLTRPGVSDFYLDAALRSLESDGPVRLFGVSVDGEWVACAYGLVGGGAFHGILLSMAGDNWRKYSPGLHIAGEIMRWARAEGLTYFDMTIGALHYKSGFSAIGHDLYELTLPLTPRGALLMRALRAQTGSKAWLRRHPRLFIRFRSVLQGLRRIDGWIRGSDRGARSFQPAGASGVDHSKEDGAS